MKRVYVFAIALVAFIYLPVSATIINIPDDYETIQEGIDASADGDTVLVQPGTYVENVNFNGHNIVLGSLFLTTGDTMYISSTMIDGDSSGSVITFENGEDSTAVITGFTIQNGLSYSGGGIFCSEASPKISFNTIRENAAFDYLPNLGMGGGIYCYNSSALIQKNNIIGNVASGFEGGYGGGIYLENLNPSVTKNVISHNFAGWFGGIISRSPGLVFANNSVFGNYAVWSGGGIFNSTCDTITILNSISWGNFPSQVSGSVHAKYSDIEGGWPGEGNIDADPLFRDPENGDFHLMSTACGDPYDSPCIDAGHPDILDSLLDCSWGLGTILSDMGAYGGGDSLLVGIDYDEIPMPDRFSVSQNYPNPFNAATIIRYTLPEPADVKIEIFDILGRKVKTLVQGEQPAGYHRIVWDAGDQSSGIYFYRIQAGDYAETRKMVLLK